MSQPQRRTSRHCDVLVVARLLSWAVFWSQCTLSVPAIADEYGRPTGSSGQSRSVVIAAHGMVATSHPLAALAGLDVLKHGGNAADAAIATNAVLGVVEPMSCGIGGDLFVMYWDAKTEKLYGLNGSGRSPYALSREVFRKKNLSQIPEHGPLSWSVPGCVAGWEDLRSRFGTRKLAELLAPAITYAEGGFPVAEVIASHWQGAEGALRRWPSSAATYLMQGRAPRRGEIFRNPQLANTYRKIAEGGANAFYRGDIAERLVKFSQEVGGYFSARDFADHRSDWVEPVSTHYRGYDVWELPPNGQGITVLQMLNLLEGYDLNALGPKNPEYLHLLVEAKKLAYADRARFYSDPAFGKPPVAELISKPYANGRRKLISAERAQRVVPPGSPLLAKGDTVYLCVVDKDRNCCSMIQSNFAGFGSGIAAADLGFALQNRGALFALDADHPNRLEPHKRPFHTIIPAMATRGGKPWFIFGVVGGDMQPQGQVQVLVNMIDFGMNVQQAGDSARVYHSGSATPTGLEGDPHGGTVALEPGFSDEVLDALKRKGHHVTRGLAFGGYQGILIDREHGTLHGGSEPRNDGCAVGY